MAVAPLAWQDKVGLPPSLLSTLQLTGAVTGLAGRERDSSEPQWSGEG